MIYLVSQSQQPSEGNTTHHFAFAVINPKCVIGYEYTAWNKQENERKPNQTWGVQIATFATIKLQGSIRVSTAIKA